MDGNISLLSSRRIAARQAIRRLWDFAQYDVFSSLPGFALSDIAQLLWTHRDSIEFKYLPRAILHLAMGALVSANAYREKRVAAAPDGGAEESAPPVFVIGHWRSGTTFLHQLLACDPRFVAPNFYQSTMPHSFLSTEPWVTRKLARYLPKTRLFDSVEMNFNAAWEDETALCTATLLSPTVAAMFPRQAEDFLPYLSFEGVPSAESARWLAGFRLFLRKLLSLRRGRPLLASPPHTARIPLLRSAFPGARFIHIHRNPYDVFSSTLLMRRRFGRVVQLQTPRPGDLETMTLSQYKSMHDSYFRHRSQVLNVSLAEIRYEQFARDPLEVLPKVYRQLDLGDFSRVAPIMRAHLHRLAGYQRNKLAPLPEDWRRRIAAEWSASFEIWKYPYSTAEGS